MRQFDVCEFKPRGLVVILQHPIADDFKTRIVAPLSTDVAPVAVKRARLQLEWNRRPHVLQLDRLAAVDRSQLGSVRGTLHDLQDDIKNGINLLFYGI